MAFSTYETLCGKFVERCGSLSLKGAKRDAYALEYMVGAASALVAVDHPDATRVATACALLVSVRGYAEIIRAHLEAIEREASRTEGEI